MLTVRHAAIIGGGFSGTLMAINLLRFGSQRVTLIERAPERLARGLAYGTAGAGHVLNVRARNMSAFPDRPGDFADWLARRGGGAAASFATRRDYGAYLAERLAEAERDAGGRLTIRCETALDLLPRGDGVRLTLASGATVDADIAVLAPGNLPPHVLPSFESCGWPLYLNDPWNPALPEGLGAADMVLLLGGGLTAVDCALTLDGAGFGGRIVMLSRRGLSPRAHAPAGPFEPLRERPAAAGPALVRAVRDRSRSVGWRNAVDELRPFTQDIWRTASPRERGSFLRHLRPYWDVHRHRIAPEVADRLDRLRAEGRLIHLPGKVMDARPIGDRLELRWRARGEEAERVLQPSRVVNCTGPLGDLRRTDDPLLRGLSARGHIRPDTLAIGIDVDRQGRAIDAAGRPQERLLAIGPMTRGAHWEIVAVPDIRRQVWDLARRITGAHWVAAEGL